MMCSSNSTYVDEADDDDDSSSSMMTRMFMSRLSIENFDADEEISDDHDDKDRNMLGSAGNFLSLDSEPSKRYSSLPATPTPRQRRRRRRRNRQQQQQLLIKDVDYASESEAQKMMMRKNMRRSRRVARERRWLERATVCNWDNHTTANCSSSSSRSNKKKGMDHEHNYISTTTCDEKYMKHYHNISESEGHAAGGGDPLTVITRPKGGRRYLCMDLEEVKACRELGFELEHHHHHHHHHMLDVMLTTSSTTLDTSSGGNSPVANWRISSPGDDPRDVKARLKLWAQAVALVSTSTSRRTL